MKARRLVLGFLLFTGCAGLDRECASCGTEVSGADWLIVQLRTDGTIRNCWRAEHNAVASERQSDGIWWVDSRSQQVHISGWYNYVQVQHGNWNDAAKTLDVELEQCVGGRYKTAEEVKTTAEKAAGLHHGD